MKKIFKLKSLNSCITLKCSLNGTLNCMEILLDKGIEKKVFYLKCAEKDNQLMWFNYKLEPNLTTIHYLKRDYAQTVGWQGTNLLSLILALVHYNHKGTFLYKTDKASLFQAPRITYKKKLNGGLTAMMVRLADKKISYDKSSIIYKRIKLKNTRHYGLVSATTYY